MMSITLWKAFRRSALVISAVLMASSAAHAGTYATNTCVGKKLSAASTACKQVLTAWKNWEKDQNSGNRDGAITSAGTKLTSAWTSAETSAAAAGADCTETTVTGAQMQADLTSAVSNIMNSINAGGAPTGSSDIKCRQSLVGAAITACQKMLTAESKLVKGLKSDVGGGKRTGAVTFALNAFNVAWETANCSAVTTPESDVIAELSALDGTAVTDTTISPTVATAWTMITPPTSVKYNGKTLTPMCTDGSQYVYFVKKGTGSDVNKLLVYYEGGGACWDYNTCSAHAETPTTGPSHNPAGATTGFFDLSNPANPFANWSMVFVPYCTGDVHWGNATTTYTDTSDSSKSITIHHNGWPNAQVVEKWTREHFVNPDVLFVAGSSAGGYGALLNSLYFLQDAYQASKAYVFDDAGAGVITPDFQATNLSLWGVPSTLPTWIRGLKAGVKDITKLNLADVAIDAANFYNPRVDFVQYATAYDQVQTLFYALMVLGDASLGVPWWTETCDWNTKMLTNLTTVAGPNYRYYIGAGDTHTVWEFNKVYSDTMGGVTPLVDWVNAMLAGDTADWQNQQCTDCNLEPGDTNPQQGPFGADGTVSCS